MAVIGISCFYHDSAAALVDNEGNILAAVQEERFSRIKHDSNFPYRSVDYCNQKAIDLGLEIEAFVYYEKPIRVFMRLLETYFNTAPRGFSSFLPAMQTWLSEKLFTRDNLTRNIKLINPKFDENDLYFSDHHLSHASSAFYPSPFKKAAVLCMDAVGEWNTTTGWIGEGENLRKLFEIDFPHSIGMLYSSFTYYCGFKVNSGEYKLMGLAPYGEPKYKEIILKELINLKEDGSFELNMKYFKFHRGLKMISSKFVNLFGMPPRNPNEPLTQFYMDQAASIQKVCEIIVLKLVRNLKLLTGSDNLCLSGGVSLNCVANGCILDKEYFDNVWIQPASGDSGSSIGAALAYIYDELKVNRKINSYDLMSSAYLGPEYNNKDIEKYLKENKFPYKKFSDSELVQKVAIDLSHGKVIGWFQGKMEFGPRALGNRSILGDPRIKDMQRTMNIKIKNRESFRPFAPVILDGFQKEYFDLDIESPYMLLTRFLQEKFLTYSDKKHKGIEKVNEIRSVLPAITHVDNSCRVQTISKNRNPRFYKLLEEFYKITDCPVLINTSFNVRGEPIVCSPEDAIRCFLYTEIDILVLENFVLEKEYLKENFKNKFNSPFLIED